MRCLLPERDRHRRCAVQVGELLERFLGGEARAGEGSVDDALGLARCVAFHVRKSGRKNEAGRHNPNTAVV